MSFLQRFVPAASPALQTPPTLPWWVRIGFPVLVVFAIRLPYFGIDVLNSDEGLYACTARIMQEGGLPYRDAWDHAAPGIFALYYVLFKLFGAWAMGAVRLTALLAHAITSLLVGAEVRRRHGDLAGTGAAVLTATALGCYLATDAIAGITESFLAPFLVAAAWGILSWIRGGKGRPVVVGVFIALATLFKIHALLIAVLLLLSGVVARRRENRVPAFARVEKLFILLELTQVNLETGFLEFKALLPCPLEHLIIADVELAG